MVVKIKSKAYNRIMKFAKRMGTKEIGGLILGEIGEKTGNIIVKNIVLLKQYYNDSHFEIKDEALMDITKNWDAKKLKSVLGWWHSHNTGSAFWSSDDDKCFRRMCNLSNFCLGIVVAFPNNKHPDYMELRCRLDIKDRMKQYVSVDDIQPIILQKKKNKFLDYHWGDIDVEISENIEEDKRVFEPCPYCQGSGVIEIDLYVDDYAYLDNELIKSKTLYN